MLGLATTNKMAQFKFQYIDMNRPLDKEIVDEAKRIIEELGWFKNITFSNYKDTQYPT